MNWLIRQVARLCLRVKDEMDRIQEDREISASGFLTANFVGSLPDDWFPPETVTADTTMSFQPGELGIWAQANLRDIPDASIEGRAKVGTEADDVTAKKWPADGPV